MNLLVYFCVRMKQKNQIKILIIACLVILVGLISIQYYLIRNTYQLTSETYVNEVKKQISPVLDAPEMDSIEDRFISEMKNLCLDKAKDSLSLLQFQLKAQFLADSIHLISKKYLSTQFRDYPLLKEIGVRVELNQILFETDGVYDTLLRKIDPPLVYIGDKFQKKSFNISTGVTLTSVELDEKEDQEAVEYYYKHHQSVDMDISNFQQKILRKMAGMLLGAVGLILAVILLFFQMYRSLIKQKKIADVKTDFANNITHELKTPLASLNLVVKSLQKEEVIQNPEMLKQLLGSMDRQNNRIQNIVDRVLESSVNRQKIHLQEVDVVKFLKDFTSDFSSETHSLKVDLEPEEFILQTDTYQLGRVIQNLLQNAEKYSPEGTEIRLKGLQNNSDYIIEIQDEGIGIPATEQERIFDKFYRVSEGNRHNVKGLGLGLYLCKQIMDSLGGSIFVQSTLKKGSTFILKIPA
mgnify:CR=1 FL=1